MTLHAKTATMVDVLLDYDGPQVALLKSDHGRHMLGVAVDRDDTEIPFFVCEIKE